MKRNVRGKLMIVLSMLVILEALALFASAADPLITLVHADQEREWYINTRTLVNPAPGVVSLWSTVIPAKGSAYDTRVRNVLKQAGRNPGRLEYIQVLEEIDCAGNTVKAWDVLFYDRKDRIVLSSPATKDMRPALDRGGETASIWKMVCTASLQDRGAPVRIARSEGDGRQAREKARE